MSKHTPGPWEINWYECTMDNEDVEYAKKKGNLNAKVGDVLWRQPQRIGPCDADHGHWGGILLTVEEADARLIAAAPDLLDVLLRAKSAIEALDGTTAENEKLLDDYRAAIAKATGAA
jgi:hypothetical protein